MANVLSEEKRQQVLGLGRLGWPLRRIEEATGIRRETAIEEATGIRRETASRYLKAAGISIRSPGGWGRRPPPKAAKEALTDPGRAAGAKPAKEVHTDSVSRDVPTRPSRKLEVSLLPQGAILNGLNLNPSAGFFAVGLRFFISHPPRFGVDRALYWAR